MMTLFPTQSLHVFDMLELPDSQLGCLMPGDKIVIDSASEAEGPFG